MRSGTTLLAQCLSRNEDVYWSERAVDDYELSQHWCDLGGIDIGVPRTHCGSCPALDASAATPDRVRAVRDGFARLPGFDGRQRFTAKLPHFFNKLPYLRAVFPDACLIVTSRDLRSTVLSTQVLWVRGLHRSGVRHHLPEDGDRCWDCAPPRNLATMRPERVFPGGDVSVLAEYWLRVHETIGREAGSFAEVAFLRHRDLVADPLGTLNDLSGRFGISAFADVPVDIDPNRNDRWSALLTRREQAVLNEFIERHRARIDALDFADRTL